MKFLAAIGLALLLLALVYVPAFLIVGGFKLPVDEIVPVIIGVTFASACFLAVCYALWRGQRASDFGVCWPAPRYFVYALVLAVPLSAAVEFGVARAHEAGPLAGMNLSLAATCFYFLLCTPVQEEFIFRGLLQTMFARELAGTMNVAWTSIAAVFASAALFALLHLEVGPVTAAGALVLGLVAGELRQRSRSLLPAILCHAIFNVPGILYP